MESKTREGVRVLAVGLVWAALWLLNAVYWRFHADEISILIVLLLISVGLVDLLANIGRGVWAASRYFRS
jgi:hypothetical protein